jgi:hypothetical protein
MLVAGYADDQDITPLLGVEEMTDVPRVHQIESTMAHHHLLVPGPRSNYADQFFHRLDFVFIVA